MIPRYRAWISETDTMINDLKGIDFENETVVLKKVYWEDGFPVECEIFEVEIGNAILMQSTELTDKNDKEIFEGDILSIETDEENVKVEVLWESKHALFAFESKKYNEKEPLAELFEDNSYPFKIIGNIWENPELLEVRT